MGAEVQADKLPDQPMVGTVYLYAATPHEPEKDEKSSVTFVEHLRSRPWKPPSEFTITLTLKTGRLFILEEESTPGQWSRTNFKLFLKK